MVVDAEVNKEQGRPLFGVDGEVCSKKCLTGPTLLEMSGYRVYQDLGECDGDVRQLTFHDVFHSQRRAGSLSLEGTV